MKYAHQFACVSSVVEALLIPLAAEVLSLVISGQMFPAEKANLVMNFL